MKIITVREDYEREWIIKLIKRAQKRHIKRMTRGKKPMPAATARRWKAIIIELQETLKMDDSDNIEQKIEVYDWMAEHFQNAMAEEFDALMQEITHPDGCPDTIGFR